MCPRLDGPDGVLAAPCPDEVLVARPSPAVHGVDGPGGNGRGGSQGPRTKPSSAAKFNLLLKKHQFCIFQPTLVE